MRINNISGCGKFGFFRIGIISVLILLLYPQSSLSWHGTVLDKETKTPIEGVVIIRSWDLVSATPAGPVSSLLTFKEVLSDKKGRFNIIKIPLSIHIPIVQHVKENRSLIFKPGYKCIVAHEKPSIIELERIPAFFDMRKKELEKAEHYYTSLWFIDTKKPPLAIADMMAREDEFLQCAFQNNRPGLTIMLPMLEFPPKFRDMQPLGKQAL
jgi:hypothetical protein